MKKINKHEYVVGYIGDRQVVYGKPEADGSVRYVDKFTILQAKKYLREIYKPSKGGIFKLVRIKP